MDFPDEFLHRLFQCAVAAAHPYACLPPALPADRDDSALVVGAGKAAAAMARAFEEHWRGPVRGLVVTRYAHGDDCRHIRILEAGHPLPDAAGRQAAEAILTQLQQHRPGERIFFLASGGGSSLLTAPAESITAEEKLAISAALLRAGAPIDQINCVRKHLSRIKGGRLAQLCEPHLVTTLAISDVPGDDPSVIASGPTVTDATTSAQALEILSRYNIAISAQVRRWLTSSRSETPKPGTLLAHPYHVVATPVKALNAAADFARSQGIRPIILGDQLEGEAREVARVLAGIAKSIQDTGAPATPPCVLLSSGETSVTLRGTGKGGRNSEFLLSLALALKGRPDIHALAADTDGIDGSEDNAGALLRPDTLARAAKLGIDPRTLLDNNNSYGFFSALGDLLITGPTRTNINDFRAIYIA